MRAARATKKTARKKAGLGRIHRAKATMSAFIANVEGRYAKAIK